MKTMFLTHALWRHWKRIGTAEKTLETRTVNGAFWRLTILETIWNFREKMKIMSLKHALWRDVKRFGSDEKNENKDGKWCIRTVFKTIWNFYVKKCGCSPLTPIGLQFVLHFWIFQLFDVLEKVVGPGLRGLHVATPDSLFGHPLLLPER